MRYEYPCDIVRDVEEFEATGREAYVVTFPRCPTCDHRWLVLEGIA